MAAGSGRPSRLPAVGASPPSKRPLPYRSGASETKVDRTRHPAEHPARSAGYGGWGRGGVEQLRWRRKSTPQTEVGSLPGGAPCNAPDHRNWWLIMVGVTMFDEVQARYSVPIYGTASLSAGGHTTTAVDCIERAAYARCSKDDHCLMFTLWHSHYPTSDKDTANTIITTSC